MQEEHVPLYYSTSGKILGDKVHITKEYSFEAAHRLCKHEGKCAHLHGHTYKLLVTVYGYIHRYPQEDKMSKELKDSMVIDFSNLGDIIKKRIIESHDHSFLNDLYGDSATAEVMCVSIFNNLSEALKNTGVIMESVRLYETPTSYAEYKGGK